MSTLHESPTAVHTEAADAPPSDADRAWLAQQTADGYAVADEFDRLDIRVWTRSPHEHLAAKRDEMGD